MSLTACETTRVASESERLAECRLFGLITSALVDASREGGGAKLAEALDWNRRLWRTLAADCAQESNLLSAPIRAQIISTSAWVSRYSGQVVRGQAAIDPLVAVNRAIMEGLSVSA